jgi:hypothetical protein
MRKQAEMEMEATSGELDARKSAVVSDRIRHWGYRLCNSNVHSADVTGLPSKKAFT